MSTKEIPSADMQDIYRPEYLTVILNGKTLDKEYKLDMMMDYVNMKYKCYQNLLRIYQKITVFHIFAEFHTYSIILMLK